MSVGNLPMCPHDGNHIAQGMSGSTYRMWLIGQIASGHVSVASASADLWAKCIIEGADAIIARLDAEAKP